MFALRPGLPSPAACCGRASGAGDDGSQELLLRAEAARSPSLRDPSRSCPIAAWRDAYRAFGAKPQRTRNSLEALTRRAEAGLPRVNALTDIYNGISVLHQFPWAVKT